MNCDLTIDGTALSSIGFTLKSVKGHLCVPEPKKQSSVSEELTSVNYFDTLYVKKSPEVIVVFFGFFATIELAEDALYTVYGKLVQPGPRAFVHLSEAKTVPFSGIMSDGATVDPLFSSGGVAFTVTLKLLKTA